MTAPGAGTGEAVDLDALAQQVIAGTWPRAQWTHAAHLAMAVWLLADRGFDAARRDLPTIIRRYNTAQGVANSDTGGFHATLTRGFLAGVHGIVRSRAGTREAALAAVLVSPLARSDWPLTYWSRERLFSVAARREWVEPDVQPLPENSDPAIAFK